MEKIKKTFLLLVFAATFIWFADSIYVFGNFTILWGKLQITSEAYHNQILWLILKNVPTVISVLIARNYWY